MACVSWYCIYTCFLGQGNPACSRSLISSLILISRPRLPAHPQHHVSDPLSPLRSALCRMTCTGSLTGS